MVNIVNQINKEKILFSVIFPPMLNMNDYSTYSISFQYCVNLSTFAVIGFLKYLFIKQNIVFNAFIYFDEDILNIIRESNILYFSPIDIFEMSCEKKIISTGTTPYQRIHPAFYLNYKTYARIVIFYKYECIM